MTDAAEDAQTDALAELFKQSFTEHHCLRCGHGEFYILPSERQTFLMGQATPQPRLLPVMTLACTRCGYIEQHLSEPLRSAAKPIDFELPGATE